MRKTNEESLAAVLKRFTEELKLSGNLSSLEITAAWEKLMGPEIAGQTDRIQIQNKTINVRIHSSVLRNDLNFRRTEILNKLKTELNDSTFEAIVFS